MSLKYRMSSSKVKENENIVNEDSCKIQAKVGKNVERSLNKLDSNIWETVFDSFKGRVLYNTLESRLYYFVRLRLLNVLTATEAHNKIWL